VNPAGAHGLRLFSSSAPPLFVPLSYQARYLGELLPEIQAKLARRVSETLVACGAKVFFSNRCTNSAAFI
jgi:hypothetical protein